MATPVTLAAVAVLAVCTLLPFSRSGAWWVRGWDFPRVQLFVFGLLVLTAVLAVPGLSGPTLAVSVSVVLCCLVVQGWWIYPYTPLARKHVPKASQKDPQRSLRILTANVLTPNRQVEPLLQMVHDHIADVVVTLESDAWWEQRLDALEATHPHTVKCALDNLYGMHLYSRLPLSETRVEFLVEEDIPSIHTLLHLPSGEQVRAHFLHPAPPSPTENEQSDERDAELVIVARSIAESEMPVVVTGDLNDVAWSRTTRLFLKLSGLLDPRIGRGMFNTFHAGVPFMRWPLDHIFHSAHFRLGEIRRLGAFGSDHFPLFSELVLEGDAGAVDTHFETNGEDEALADDLASEESVSKEDVPSPGSR
ncbi:MAG: endonuclease [Rhodothermales bacterium]|nr:endonuclease [Rhodothermales bacterium]